MGYKGDSHMDAGFFSDGKTDIKAEEALARSCRQIKEKLRVRPVNEPCFIIVAAVSREPHSNTLHKLSHHRSTPIGGVCYNAIEGCYHVECLDHLALGYVTKSFVVEMEGVGTWESRVPMSESVLNKLFSPEQQRDLQRFKSLHRDDQVRYEFFQFLDLMSVE